MENLSNSQVIAIIAALVGSIYLLGRVIEVLAKVIWSKRQNGAGKKDDNAFLKEIGEIILRLDENGSPMVYSRGLAVAQRDALKNQTEITAKLSEITKSNENVGLVLKEISLMNKLTLENQRELYILLVEKKARD